MLLKSHKLNYESIYVVHCPVDIDRGVQPCPVGGIILDEDALDPLSWPVMTLVVWSKKKIIGNFFLWKEKYSGDANAEYILKLWA